MGSKNDAIIEAAARLIQVRSTPNVPGLSMPDSWRDIGIDLQYDEPKPHTILRLRPVEDAVSVEVFCREDMLAAEVVLDYASADELADKVEDVFRRAVAR